MPYQRKDREGWWFRCTDPETGKRVQRYGGPNKRDAKATEDSFKRRTVHHGNSVTLQDFLTQTFLPEQRANLAPFSLRRELSIINTHLLPGFSGPLADITPEKITQYKNTRLQTANPHSVRKELQVLKHALSEAVKFGKLGKNPFDNVKLPKGAPGRLRYLQPDEWPRLLAAVPEQYRAIVTFLVNTGCRRTEACELKWDTVDLKQGVVYIDKDKPNRGKIVPLSPEICAMLDALPREIGNPQVFFWIKSANALTEIFRTATRRAGITNFRLHDLRHTFASWVRKQGHGIDIIAKLLGHGDLRMSQIYTHLFDEKLTEASASLRGIFSGNCPPNVPQSPTDFIN